MAPAAARTRGALQAGDEGPACRQCGSTQALRWSDWRGRGSVYCLACWQGWGSEAANVLAACASEPRLQPPQRGSAGAPVLFAEGPRAAEPAPPGGRCGEALNCEVTPEDSLEAAARLLRERLAEGGAVADGADGESLPPMVLNMANAEWVGGGFLTGASGQEEDICRRSNLFPQLLEVQKEDGYPIPELGAVVLPDVTVFRGPQQAGYERLAEPFRIAVVTAAAPSRPDLSTEEAQSAYAERMRAKVDALLAVVEHLGYSELVLSAWGCGAFRNPPEQVARIFREALLGRFAGCFRRVVFAVFDRADWREGNCAVFRRVLAA